MNAAVLGGPRALTIRSRPELVPGPDEAVIRVRAAGLCGTDYRIWSGDRLVGYPLVMGHEVVGTVAAVGSGVDDLPLRPRVAVEPHYLCGNCPPCRAGHRQLCLFPTPRVI